MPLVLGTDVIVIGWRINQSIKPLGAVKHSGERLKCFAWVSQQFAPVDSPYVRLKLDSVFYLHSLEAPSFKWSLKTTQETFPSTRDTPLLFLHVYNKN